jgi:hypothetical protein
VVTGITICRFAASAAVAILTLTSATFVHAHGDVWLYADVLSDQLAVGIADEGGTTFTPGERVFEGILTPDLLPFSPFDFSASDPGFRSAAGDLPPSQPIGLTVSSLKVWNGAGLDPATDVAFAFDLTGGVSSAAAGSVHEHPLFGLATLTATPVPDGVYMASVRASTAGLGDSEEFFFVLLKDDLITNENDVETLEGLLEDFENGGPAPIFGGKDFSFYEEAVEFVDAVPEPSGLALGGVAMLIGVARLRRR